MKRLHGFPSVKAAVLALGMFGFSSIPGDGHSATGSNITVHCEEQKEEAALLQQNKLPAPASG
jgi:hypothetical protein